VCRSGIVAIVLGRSKTLRQNRNKFGNRAAGRDGRWDTLVLALKSTHSTRILKYLAVAVCIALLYTLRMIQRFLHKGLEVLFYTGSKAGVQPAHANRLRLQLARMETAASPRDMDLPGWRLHPLKGQLKGHWAVWVDQNWRLVFTFDGDNADLVDYRDYH
jgi:toxin HigB-1